MEKEKDVLQDVLAVALKRRRDLLPLWIKIFIWIFLLFGAFVPVAIVVGMLGGHFALSLYGLESNDPYSYISLLLLAVYLLKGIVAVGLWQEKSWAVDLGIVDAIVGLIICLGVMVYPVVGRENGTTFNFRLEFLLLVPYLVKLFKIRQSWKSYYSRNTEI
jgi:hypothetical protein